MIRAVIFDMGGTLLRFVRPGTGSWREMEERGIRDLYRYFVDQGNPITEHEDDFVEVMFARLAEGWEQSTGGHINLRAVDWIAAGAERHSLSLNEQALFDAAQAYARPIRAVSYTHLDVYKRQPCARAASRLPRRNDAPSLKGSTARSAANKCAETSSGEQ